MVKKQYSKILSGMREICKYVSRCDATVLQWVRHYNFPAAKIGGIWEAYQDDIDAWHRKYVDEQPYNGKNRAAKKKKTLKTMP